MSMSSIHNRETVGGRMQAFVQELQRTIRSAIEEMDGQAVFQEDAWVRSGGGGGLSAVLAEGAVFEKAGVNTSVVYGELPEQVLADLLGNVSGADTRSFFATGISLVFHPRNPHVPSVHANFRYFALGDDLAHPVNQWFGGGADLTPYYPVLKDIQHFHRTWKDVCDAHDAADYEAFKKRCDTYFYLPHRGEARGVGGIFFDGLREAPEGTFAFVQEAGKAFLHAYAPIVARRRHEPYGEREQAFQALRRARYVEFNLLYDRGTKFGIDTGGRTESILMSLPPVARWEYDWTPDPGTPEARLQWFLQPRDWLSLPSGSDAP